MNREELIKKWLDRSLNPEEEKAFEQLDDSQKLAKLDRHLKSFQTPSFNTEEAYAEFKSNVQSGPKRGMHWLNSIIRIAAIIVLGFSIFFYVVSRDTQITTDIAQQSTIELPDNSTVKINANSSISFNKWHWNNDRQVSLVGEAFFKVAKGQKFDVVTKSGIVSVLGTEFNVKYRPGIFDVACFEGKVAVEHNGKSLNLIAGESFTLIDGEIIAEKKDLTAQPNWLRGESQFSSVPLKYVINELENQYNISVKYNDVDSMRLFSGGFTNKNLDQALQSISIPLNLKYQKLGNTVILARE